MIMRETLDDYEGELKIGRRKVANLRKADDVVFITAAPQDFQELLD